MRTDGGFGLAVLFKLLHVISHHMNVKSPHELMIIVALYLKFYLILFSIKLFEVQVSVLILSFSTAGWGLLNKY